MKALVLTCDRYRTFTENTIAIYSYLWPEHPFTFHIPFQENDDPIPDVLPESVVYFRSPSRLRETVLCLLDDIDNEEFVFWCLDDKYARWINVKFHQRLYRLLIENRLDGVDGICTCRCRTLWWQENTNTNEKKAIAGMTCLRRTTYSEIWVHQFLRAKVIRHLFDRMPSDIPAAKWMDQYIQEIPLPDEHRLWVTRNSQLTLGESTTRGEITYNCYRLLKSRGISIPSGFEISRRSILMGYRFSFFEFLIYQRSAYRFKLAVLDFIHARSFLRRLHRIIWRKSVP